jgi:uncharacterized protein DUF6188
MHPFPTAIELGFLVGLEVVQIRLDPWSTQFLFSDGGQITLEDRFEYTDVSGQVHTHQGEEEIDRGTVAFRELLQQRIASVQVEAHALTLVFGNGTRLVIHSDEGPYECGQIYPPGPAANPIVF